MEDITYNILWIDDEHESLNATKGRARRNKINLIPFKSLNGGINELEQNYPFYDGVLLDAKFFENEDDVKGSEDTYNVHRAKERLLKLDKKFDVFVLTGQAEAYDNDTFQKAFTKVYKKGSDEEMNKLFSDIKESAKNQQDTQLRHTYRRVFDVCNEKYIGEYAGQDILTLLKIKDEGSIENNFNSIRKIVEDLFSAFNKFNLLPADFVNPHIALNQSSIFLSGKDQYDSTDPKYKKYRHLEETHLPAQITSNLRNILTVTQSGSHRSDIDLHVREVKTNYLLKSILYQLLDVIVWFKIYIDSNPKTGNWEENDSEIAQTAKPNYSFGKVINLNQYKGFAFFKPDDLGDNIFITPHLVSKYSLKNDMHIKVDTEEYIDHRNGETKTRVNFIELI